MAIGFTHHPDGDVLTLAGHGESPGIDRGHINAGITQIGGCDAIEAIFGDANA
jgi:hypothetical protein